MRGRSEGDRLARVEVDLTESKGELKHRLTVWYHNFSGVSQIADTFTVSEKMRAQDTWFLLVISAIVAQLRLVGDIFNLIHPKLVRLPDIAGDHLI